MITTGRFIVNQWDIEQHQISLQFIARKFRLYETINPLKDNIGITTATLNHIFDSKNLLTKIRRIMTFFVETISGLIVST